MTTYYHGGGEIQVDGGGDNLQTLYLMNPNSYITSTPYSNNHHHHHQQLLLNTTIIPQPSSNPQQQQFSGIPLAGPHQNWSPTSEGIPTQVGMVHSSVGHTEFKNPGPHTAQGSLSLSLSPGRQQNVKMSVTVASGPEVIIRSKYLRSTQELLEEVVNVVGLCDNGASRGVDRDNKAKSTVKVDDDVVRVGHYGGTGEGASGSSNKGAELSTVHRHELQMKKAKLLNMLDEVEQRYRQYHTQMQLVVSSFEQAAGIGSAKSYTSLALKTISKQFRCLKDAITSQIKSASKSLGEDDNVGRVKLEGGAGSRLKLVDQQLRQQRALQQFGMMHQHNAWRPQRGLPERAVTVLRAWLFEHFLHPYDLYSSFISGFF